MNRYGVLNIFIAIALIASVTAIDCNNKPDFKEAKECCPNQGLAKNEILEACKSHKEEKEADDAKPPGPGRRHHLQNACYSECIMNATGLVNFETMAVDEAKTKTYLTALHNSMPDIVQVMSDGMVKCAEKVKDMREMRKNDARPPPMPGKCKPCASMFMHCVDREILINCPTSAWKNDEKCNNIREFMMVCKPPKGGPPK